MFIEFKDLKKKRNIALLTVIFLIFGGAYFIINNKGNIQRVESVIYIDKTISEKLKVIAFEVLDRTLILVLKDHFTLILK